MTRKQTKLSAKEVSEMEKQAAQARYSTPEKISRDLKLASGSLDTLLRDLGRAETISKGGYAHVRETIASVESILAKVRNGVALAEWYAADEPRTTHYVLTAPVRHTEYVNRDRDLEDVVEAIRGYAFPTVWGFQRVTRSGRDYDGIRVEFSIEENERRTHEYMDEIKDALLSTIVSNDYILTDITDKKEA